MQYCSHCGKPITSPQDVITHTGADPLAEAFSKLLTSLGASFVDTPSESCNECGLTVGHWSQCSHLRDGVYEATEG